MDDPLLTAKYVSDLVDIVNTQVKALQNISEQIEKSKDFLNAIDNVKKMCKEIAEMDLYTTQKTKKSRGIDFKVLEIIDNDPKTEWTPKDIVIRLRNYLVHKSDDELLSTTYLALSRLYSDGLLDKIDRGVYRISENDDNLNQLKLEGVYA